MDKQGGRLGGVGGLGAGVCKKVEKSSLGRKVGCRVPGTWRWEKGVGWMWAGFGPKDGTAHEGLAPLFFPKVTGLGLSEKRSTDWSKGLWNFGENWPRGIAPIRAKRPRFLFAVCWGL